MPGMALGALYIHSFNPSRDPTRYYHCFHFTDEEIDIKQELTARDHTAIELRLDPVGLASESLFLTTNLSCL